MRRSREISAEPQNAPKSASEVWLGRKADSARRVGERQGNHLMVVLEDDVAGPLRP